MSLRELWVLRGLVWLVFTKTERLTCKLENPSFVEKAPPQVVEKNREELSALLVQLDTLDET